MCNRLTKKMRKKMPYITDEKAEVINYGLQLIIGEIPKIFIVIIIAYLCGVLRLTALGLLFILPYKMVSGGVHLKTHIGCIIFTNLFYVGNAILSKSLVFATNIKYLITSIILIFTLIMVKLYAPADTEAVPILRKKERRIKKILSYIIASLTLLIATVVKDSTISNLLIFGTLFQTLTITKFVYKISKNKYGYEEYIKSQIQFN
jgi:accessory gene regulator B